MQTFREWLREKEINEAKNAGAVQTFDIYQDGVKIWQSQAGNAADQIVNKMKTKKFQEIKDKLKITRTDKYGVEDLTDLFIK